MPDPIYTFHKSAEELRRLGSRGGRAYGRNRRAREALLKSPPEPMSPRVVALPPTTAESIAVLDARFSWLRGAESRMR